MKYTQLIALVTGLALSGASHAALITFDFTGGGPNSRVLTFDQSGVTLTAKGRSLPNRARVTNNRNGLGVQGSGSGQLNGPYELIEFSISQPATWVSATLWNLGNREAVAFCGTSATYQPACESAATFVDGRGNLNPMNVSLDAISGWNYANIGAAAGGFRIASLTVNTVGVPEPGTLGLLAVNLLGLLGLGALRRRRVT